MKFLVLLQMPAGGRRISADAAEIHSLTESSKDWVRRHKEAGRLDSVYTFPEGGGCMVVEADSAEDLHTLIYSNPSALSMGYEIHMLLDFEGGMDHLNHHFQAYLRTAHPVQERA